jgi:hypothetical protein
MRKKLVQMSKKPRKPSNPTPVKVEETPAKTETNIIIGVASSPVIIQQEKKPTNFKTVGTCRKSKAGNALSIKLFPENRFLHIAIRDIELIIDDKDNSTVANVREYEKLENVSEVKKDGS